jgi:hypothetical protein
MKKFLIIPFLITAHAGAYTTDMLYGISFFKPRSVADNAARDIAGIHQFIYDYYQPDFFTLISVTPAFNHSLRSDLLAINFFGTNCFDIVGSQVGASLTTPPERRYNTLLADYFGLSPVFESRVRVAPQIINTTLMFDGYFGLNGFCDGLYARIQLPVAWTRWSMHVKEDVLHPTTADDVFPAEYMDVPAVSPLVHSWRGAMAGNNAVGQITQDYRYGKIACGSLSKHGLAAINIILGYNIAWYEDAHVGIELRVSAPTGNRPTAEYMFEPLIGNSKHWEVGADFTGHVLLWEKDGEQEWNFFGQINATHFCKSKQRRSFDLCRNGFFSRYLLLKTFDADGNYTNETIPAINVTTLDCSISNAIQLDIVALFGYTYAGFVFDIGYNGWIRSSDKIDILGSIPTETYGIKGIQNVSNAGLPSNATQHEATIFGNNFSDQALETDPNSPIFISTNDLNHLSASTGVAVTSKFFTHIGYSWDCPSYSPFIGIGGEIEFEGINPRNTARIFSPTLAQWGVWLKGGVGL